MSIKVLGGTAKGLSLKVPSGSSIRPTSVMLRRKVFDSNQSLEGFVFIDCCAGTGAMGIEALSRGAELAYFVEPNRKVFNLLRQNVRAALERVNSNAMASDVLFNYSIEKFVSNEFLKIKENALNRGLDLIVFFDPPYESHDLYKKTLVEKLLPMAKEEEVEFWIESDNKKGVLINYFVDLEIDFIKSFTHSDSYLGIFKNCK